MARPIYFFVQDITDSELVVLGDYNEGSVECKDTFDLYVYDLSLYNGNLDDLDYMKVEKATERDLEDSPGSPYIAEGNHFYEYNKEDFVDRDLDHSPREMAEIYRDLINGGMPQDKITKDQVKEVLESYKEQFSTRKTK